MAVGRGEAVVSARVGGAGAEARITVEFAASVAFVGNSVRVAEGETRVIGIRYRVWRLAAVPLAIRVSLIEDGAESVDYACW